MLSNPAAVAGGTIFVLLALLTLVVLLGARHQRQEHKRRWQQLSSVYEHQERRIRGDG